MIEFINVSKEFKKNENVLSNINLEIESGKIYTLLGRNGAGKSTLMNLIANNTFASSGIIKINDKLLNQSTDISKTIHLLSENNYYRNDIKIINHFKNLKTINSNFDYDNALNLAKIFSLDVNNKLKELSIGYLNLFKLCIAFSLNVQYLLLDEPTSGLDANHRKLFYKLLLEYYQKHSNTIVISSHIIDELTNIIEEVIIIKNGKIILKEEVDFLLNNVVEISGKSALMADYLKYKRPFLIDDQKHITKAYFLEQLDMVDNPGLSMH